MTEVALISDSATDPDFLGSVRTVVLPYYEIPLRSDVADNGQEGGWFGPLSYSSYLLGWLVDEWAQKSCGTYVGHGHLYTALRVALGIGTAVLDVKLLMDMKSFFVDFNYDMCGNVPTDNAAEVQAASSLLRRFWCNSLLRSISSSVVGDSSSYLSHLPWLITLRHERTGQVVPWAAASVAGRILTRAVDDTCYLLGVESSTARVAHHSATSLSSIPFYYWTSRHYLAHDDASHEYTPRMFQAWYNVSHCLEWPALRMLMRGDYISRGSSLKTAMGLHAFRRLYGGVVSSGVLTPYILEAVAPLLQSYGIDGLVEDPKAAEDEKNRRYLMRQYPGVFTPQEVAKVVGLFHECDQNGNGVIEPSEIRELLQRMGQDESMDHVKQILDEVDSDHDGVISFPEYAEIVVQVRKGGESNELGSLLKRWAVSSWLSGSAIPNLVRSLSSSAAEVEQKYICVICSVNQRSVMVLPCKHICLCSECASSMAQMSHDQPSMATYRRCPICRQQVERTKLVRL